MLAALALLPVLALATPLELVKRDGASITQAIGYISSNITKVNSTLNTFQDGDIITALTIQGQASDLTNSVSNAQTVVSNSAALSDSESGNVAFAVLNLEPQIFSLIDNLVAHKPQFDTVIFGYSASFLVKYDLQQSQNASDSFGAALVPKLTAAYQSAAPQIISQIDAKFESAISTFSS